MIEWAKEHWYWLAGGLVGIWLLMKLLESGSSSSTASSVAPTGTAITYTGTNANDAAVQVAQTQSQSALAAAQIAAGQAVQIAQISEQATANTNDANVKIAGISASAADVASNNATTLGIVQSNNGATVAITQANDAYQLGVNTNATNLQALENTNATQLQAYGIQAAVANNQIQALQTIATVTSNNSTKVQTQALADATQLQAQQLTNSAAATADTYNLVKSGTFNKGGEGGTNQVAAWSAALNPNSAASGDAASAAVGAAQASSNQIASIISAIGGAVKNGASAVFA